VRNANAGRDILKTPVALLPDGGTLTTRLTAALNGGGDGTRPVIILKRELPPFMSTFPNEIVTCRLPDGRKRRVFVKYQAGQSHRSYGHRGDIPYETEVYRRVLHPLRDFRPRCLGAHRDLETGDTSLFLEYVYCNVRLSDMVWKRSTRQPRAMIQAARWGQLSVPRHDLYFTIGERLAGSWIHIRPPVCLESWPYVFNRGSEAFTTVSNWDSSDWIVDGDDAYENTKRVAFLEFADLPRMTGQPLELALFMRTERDMAEQNDLERRGWRIRHSSDVAATPETYQAYIQNSRGEFSCAKRSYVEFQNAWISDRTLCYLASGKPVVVQNTGPSAFLPDGEGMFRFSTAAEAADAFAAINANYERHCRAAREIAEAHFDARRSLETILNVALSAHVSAVGGR